MWRNTLPESAQHIGVTLQPHRYSLRVVGILAASQVFAQAIDDFAG
jgi:hypothetical protein